MSQNTTTHKKKTPNGKITEPAIVEALQKKIFKGVSHGCIVLTDGTGAIVSISSNPDLIEGSDTSLSDEKLKVAANIALKKSLEIKNRMTLWLSRQKDFSMLHLNIAINDAHKEIEEHKEIETQ